jgi:hypothetical protein
MTTPAKNINLVTFSTGQYTRWRTVPAPEVIEFDGSVGPRGTGYLVDIRPASGNAGRVKKFLLCRAWDHWIADLQMDKRSNSVVHSVGPDTYRERWTQGSFWNGGSTPPVPEEPSTNMINWAMVKALNKVKEQDIHLGNFIAEFHKTVQTVSSRATKIANQVERFKVKHPKDWTKVKAVQTGNLPRHRWCEIPNSWLELQYGWKPLLQDVEGGLKAMFKVARRDIPVIVASAQVKDVVPSSSSALSIDGSYKATLNWQSERTARVQLCYRVDNPVLHELSSLGLVNPLEVVWELTKYSFVVDWFLPIGPWLSSLTGDAGMSFITGSVTKRTNMTFLGSNAELNSPSSGYSPGPDGVTAPVYTGKYFHLNRSCLTSSPFPGIYVKNPMSALHAANAIALLVQAFRR